MPANRVSLHNCPSSSMSSDWWRRAHRQYTCTHCVCWHLAASATPLCSTCTGPPSSHGWRTPPARGADSPRRLIASASTRWSTAPAATDTARRIYRRLTNCETLRTTNFSARQCVCRTTFYMHCCRRRPLHHNVTICENAHNHCSYLNILLTCQTNFITHMLYKNT